MSEHAAALRRALVLTAVGIVAGLAFNALRPGGLRASAFRPPTQCDEAAGAPRDITAAEAAALCGQSSVLIADTRPAAAFEQGHIAGAVHLPCDAGGAVAADAIGKLDGATTILVYGEGTEQARPVAASLTRRHHADVRVLVGGFAAWAAAGLACASGACKDCGHAGAEHQSQAPVESHP